MFASLQNKRKLEEATSSRDDVAPGEALRRLSWPPIGSPHYLARLLRRFVTRYVAFYLFDMCMRCNGEGLGSCD